MGLSMIARVLWLRRVLRRYAATETGGIAAECRQHRGVHLFEDLVIPEVVDDDYRPALPGQTALVAGPAPGKRPLVMAAAHTRTPVTLNVTRAAP